MKDKTPVLSSDLVDLEPETGTARLSFHPGQNRAWNSKKRFIAVLAGSQGGKTSFGPWWLWREIQTRGGGDYLAVTATFPLLRLKMLPEFIRVFDTVLHMGRWWAADRIYELANPETGKCAERASDPMWGRVIFGSAKNADSLESATAKAAWLDEAGQSHFRIDAWEAILRRLSLHEGRALITTTLYNFGWLKREVYDPWLRGERDDVEIIQFKSKDNPCFPLREYERAKRTMPSWRFSMFYEGQYSRPAGMIYDSFDGNICVIEPFDIPGNWPLYVGIDFGGVHMAAIFTAEDPDTGRLYHFDEYLMGGRSIAQHAEAFKRRVGLRPLRWIGGARPEEQWREEFRKAGVPVMPPPISDVEVGISRVYALHKQKQIFVFRTLSRYLDEVGSYSRVLDENNEPTEEIEDKNTFHLLDAERVLISYLYTTRNRLDPSLLSLLSQPTQSRWMHGMMLTDAMAGAHGSSRWQRGKKY